MKTSKNSCKFFATLCTGLLLTACTGEELLTDTATEGTGRVMYATAAYNENNSPKTRMSYEDDLIKDYMTLAWSAGDAFSAFISTDATNTKHEFAIVAPEAGKDYTTSEKFKCSDFPKETADGTVIDAIYPSSSVSSETSLDPKNVTLSLAAQTQAKHKDTEHLKQYDYMVGHAIYHSKTPEELNFSFTDHGDGNAGRLASIYRVTLTLPAGVGKVNSIKLTATDKNDAASLTDALALNFTKGAISTVPRSHNGVTLTVTDGTTVASGENKQFIAYVMLYPSLIKTLTTEVKTDVGTFTKANEYVSEIVSTRGEFKLIAVDMTGVTPTIPDYKTYDADGEGTETAPYQIWNETQLRDLAAKTNATASIAENKYFKLVSNIDLSEGEWTPIGTNGQRFKGHFDGNGHSVKGIIITQDIQHAGLFGYTEAGSSIKDLSAAGSIKNESTANTRFAGGLVGYNKGTITACSSIVTVTADGADAQAGGLVGNNGYCILACYSTGAVKATGTSAKVGGLAGNNQGYIYACYATGEVAAAGTSANVGSLVGYTNNEIWYCLTTGSIGTADANRVLSGITVNGEITGVGTVSREKLATHCHGGDGIKNTLNTEGATGFGMLNDGLSQIKDKLGIDCPPYHYVAGDNDIPVLAPGAP